MQEKNIFIHVIAYFFGKRRKTGKLLRESPFFFFPLNAFRHEKKKKKTSLHHTNCLLVPLLVLIFNGKRTTV
jgi:hypothetical protein